MAQQLCQILRRQRLEDKDLTPGQQRGIDLKGGVLGGGADENDASLLHKGEKGVLLRLVEAVNLIDKQQGGLPHDPIGLRLLHDLFDLFDAAGHSAEVNEVGSGLSCDNPGQRSLSNSRRAPEDHGGHLVLLNELAQNLSLSQQVLLPHILLQRLRTQPACQGTAPLSIVKQGLLLHAVTAFTI